MSTHYTGPRTDAEEQRAASRLRNATREELWEICEAVGKTLRSMSCSPFDAEDLACIAEAISERDIRRYPFSQISETVSGEPAGSIAERAMLAGAGIKKEEAA
ncbi:MAG: hypothetical protein VX529_06700 [Pseudomonadota bacterium]|nr:hypothetical protein [Pseudomonadota bacterium]